MTVKTMITELTSEQMEKVYHANKQLQDELQDDMYDTEMMYIDEMLHCFKDSLKDYSISSYGKSYLEVDEDKLHDFIDGIKKANSSYGMMPEESYKQIEEVEKKIDQLYNEVEMYTDNYDILEGEILEDVKALCEIIADYFGNILYDTYKEEYQIDYLKEFYADNRIENTYIVIDEEGNSDYILNEDITKTYN